MATYTPYVLPGADQANQGLRTLQGQSVSGLGALMNEDTSAQRQSIQDAMYQSQAEGINRSAGLQRQAMLEGTFARGVGDSTMTQELAGRLAQEQNDANARAAREAYIGAGSEQRANLASQQGLYSAGFGAGTTGLQAEANVGLTNTGRELQASQANDQLEIQRTAQAMQSQQFQQNLAKEYAAMEQQAGQFGRTLTVQEEQAALNRALQLTLQESGQTFQGGQATQAQDFQAQQNALNRALQAAQFDASLGQQRDLAGNQQLIGGVGAGLAGLANLFGPTLTAGKNAINDWLTGLFNLQNPTPTE